MIKLMQILGLVAALVISAVVTVAAKEDKPPMTNKTLVVYFSYSGNTKRIADLISAETGADTARIETIAPYVGTMDEISEQGKKEVEQGYLPPIKPLGVNPAEYKRIVIGTPTWWYTMAPAVRAFLRQIDWQGKEVVLYMTNAGWPGHVIADMKKAVAGAKVIADKEILFDSDGGNELITPESEIKDWINGWQF